MVAETTIVAVAHNTADSTEPFHRLAYAYLPPPVAMLFRGGICLWGRYIAESRESQGEEIWIDPVVCF